MTSLSQPPEASDKKSSKEDDSDSRMWKALVEWVNQGEGGYVHPNLYLALADADNDDAAAATPPNRSVYAQAAIPKGTLLIRLPLRLVVQGGSMPEHYNHDNDDGRQQLRRNASPWLRCIAAYIQAATNNTNDMAPYMASLPETYETLWQWTDEEIDSFLAGTSPPASPVGSCSSWKLDRTALRQRYRAQIRPYLVHCKLVTADAIDDEEDEEREFDLFATACQALSTRGFHMEHHVRTETPAAAGTAADSSCPSSYSGPFLLPVMDLLNHASTARSSASVGGGSKDARKSPSPSPCTTLKQQIGDGTFFVMVAERDVAAQEQVLHSYGDALCSSQFLASFGFVPYDAVERAATPQQQQ